MNSPGKEVSGCVSGSFSESVSGSVSESLFGSYLSATSNPIPKMPLEPQIIVCYNLHEVMAVIQFILALAYTFSTSGSNPAVEAEETEETTPPSNALPSSKDTPASPAKPSVPKKPVLKPSLRPTRPAPQRPNNAPPPPPPPGTSPPPLPGTPPPPPSDSPVASPTLILLERPKPTPRRPPRRLDSLELMDLPVDSEPRGLIEEPVDSGLIEEPVDCGETSQYFDFEAYEIPARGGRETTDETGGTYDNDDFSSSSSSRSNSPVDMGNRGRSGSDFMMSNPNLTRSVHDLSCLDLTECDDDAQNSLQFRTILESDESKDGSQVGSENDSEDESESEEEDASSDDDGSSEDEYDFGQEKPSQKSVIESVPTVAMSPRRARSEIGSLASIPELDEDEEHDEEDDDDDYDENDDDGGETAEVNTDSTDCEHDDSAKVDVDHPIVPEIENKSRPSVDRSCFGKIRIPSAGTILIERKTITEVITEETFTTETIKVETFTKTVGSKVSSKSTRGAVVQEKDVGSRVSDSKSDSNSNTDVVNSEVLSPNLSKTPLTEVSPPKSGEDAKSSVVDGVQSKSDSTPGVNTSHPSTNNAVDSLVGLTPDPTISLPNVKESTGIEVSKLNSSSRKRAVGEVDLSVVHLKNNKENKKERYFEGTLLREVEKKTYCKVFCLVRGTMMLIFKDKAPPIQDELTVCPDLKIDLSEAECEIFPHSCGYYGLFQIKLHSGQEYLIQARDDIEMRFWVHKIGTAAIIKSIQSTTKAMMESLHFYIQDSIKSDNSSSSETSKRKQMVHDEAKPLDGEVRGTTQNKSMSSFEPNPSSESTEHGKAVNADTKPKDSNESQISFKDKIRLFESSMNVKDVSASPGRSSKNKKQEDSGLELSKAAGKTEPSIGHKDASSIVSDKCKDNKKVKVVVRTPEGKTKLVVISIKSPAKDKNSSDKTTANEHEHQTQAVSDTSDVLKKSLPVDDALEKQDIQSPAETNKPGDLQGHANSDPTAVSTSLPNNDLNELNVKVIRKASRGDSMKKSNQKGGKKSQKKPQKKTIKIKKSKSNDKISEDVSNSCESTANSSDQPTSSFDQSLVEKEMHNEPIHFSPYSATGDVDKALISSNEKDASQLQENEFSEFELSQNQSEITMLPHEEVSSDVAPNEGSDENHVLGAHEENLSENSSMSSLKNSNSKELLSVVGSVVRKELGCEPISSWVDDSGKTDDLWKNEKVQNSSEDDKDSSIESLSNSNVDDGSLVNKSRSETPKSKKVVVITMKKRGRSKILQDEGAGSSDSINLAYEAVVKEANRALEMQKRKCKIIDGVDHHDHSEESQDSCTLTMNNTSVWESTIPDNGPLSSTQNDSLASIDTAPDESTIVDGLPGSGLLSIRSSSETSSDGMESQENETAFGPEVFQQDISRNRLSSRFSTQSEAFENEDVLGANHAPATSKTSALSVDVSYDDADAALSELTYITDLTEGMSTIQASPESQQLDWEMEPSMLNVNETEPQSHVNDSILNSVISPSSKSTTYVHFEGLLNRKQEKLSYNKRAQNRSWERLYAVVHGKFLRFYKDKKAARTRRDSLHNKEAPVDLTDAKCDKAYDYTKRRYVLKLTLYGGAEYLIQCADEPNLKKWQSKIITAAYPNPIIPPHLVDSDNSYADLTAEGSTMGVSRSEDEFWVTLENATNGSSEEMEADLHAEELLGEHYPGAMHQEPDVSSADYTDNSSQPNLTLAVSGDSTADLSNEPSSFQEPPQGPSQCLPSGNESMTFPEGSASDDNLTYPPSSNEGEVLVGAGICSDKKDSAESPACRDIYGTVEPDEPPVTYRQKSHVKHASKLTGLLDEMKKDTKFEHLCNLSEENAFETEGMQDDSIGSRNLEDRKDRMSLVMGEMRNSQIFEKIRRSMTEDDEDGVDDDDDDDDEAKEITSEMDDSSSSPLVSRLAKTLEGKLSFRGRPMMPEHDDNRIDHTHPKYLEASLNENLSESSFIGDESEEDVNSATSLDKDASSFTLEEPLPFPSEMRMKPKEAEKFPEILPEFLGQRYSPDMSIQSLSIHSEAAHSGKSSYDSDTFIEVALQGYLIRKVKYKRADRLAEDRSWRKIYCVLRGGRLHFYKDNDIFLANPKAYLNKERPVNLLGANCKALTSADPGRKHLFRLELLNGAEYLFDAENDSNCNNWLSNINQTVHNQLVNLKHPTESTDDLSSEDIQIIPNRPTPDWLEEHFQGYLIRKQKWVSASKMADSRSWDRLFCVLDGNQLAFYKDEKSYEKHPNIFFNKEPKLDLSGAEARPLQNFRKKHVLALRWPNGRTYLFQCNGDDEMVFWVYKLNVQSQIFDMDPEPAPSTRHQSTNYLDSLDDILSERVTAPSVIHIDTLEVLSTTSTQRPRSRFTQSEVSRQ